MKNSKWLAQTEAAQGVVMCSEAAQSGRAWTVVQADAFRALELVPARSVDCIIADPPYFLSNGGTTNRGGKRTAVDKGEWDRSRGALSDFDFQLAWLARAQRLLRPSGTLWVSGTQHAIFSIGWAMQQLGWHFLNTIAWHKPNPPQNLGCRGFTHSHETLIWAAPQRGAKLRHVFNDHAMRDAAGGKPMHDVWESIPAPGPRERCGHPTQKPVALYERALLASTRPGDLVLDPFCGSGTAGVAALRHKRRFVGIEKDNAWFRVACKRLSAA